MKIPTAKLKAILLYFCNYTDTTFLGKTKLMKLFYFADFTHLKQFGSPITYDTYVKLEHGPIPSTIKSLVDTACENID
ncbi:MAG: SocA family protein, partial [Candidatus Aenigmarchaeota archaeon]|nr:SocA family protein [Candidatus Aenigmarchaeota archaeon]